MQQRPQTVISSMLSKRNMAMACDGAKRAKVEDLGFDKTFTITLGDMAENHVGMQKIGSMATEGFSLSDLETAQRWFSERGVECELGNLKEVGRLEHPLASSTADAYILIARGGLRSLLALPLSSAMSTDHSGEASESVVEASEEMDSVDAFFREQDTLPKDTKAFMYGRVVNKHARHNLCFGEFDQEPDYEEKKGRVIGYPRVPLLDHLRRAIPEVIGKVGEDLVAEGNYYYDLRRCGIGYHGDTERQKVVGVRVGASMPLCFAWFHNSAHIPTSTRVRYELHHGDVYFFSQKATGNDWKRKSLLSLRHSAGTDKFISLPKK